MDKMERVVESDRKSMERKYLKIQVPKSEICVVIYPSSTERLYIFGCGVWHSPLFVQSHGTT